MFSRLSIPLVAVGLLGGPALAAPAPQVRSHAEPDDATTDPAPARTGPRIELGLHGGLGTGGAWSTRSDQPGRIHGSPRPLAGLTVGVELSPALSAEIGGILPLSPGDPGRWSRPVQPGPSFARSFAAWDLSATVRFSPVPLTFTSGGPFGGDFYAVAGAGLLQTVDDLEGMGCRGVEGEPCTLVARQTHPTAILGAGLRLRWTSALTTRIEARSTTFIETFQGATLARKSPILLQLGMTVLL